MIMKKVNHTINRRDVVLIFRLAPMTESRGLHHCLSLIAIYLIKRLIDTKI